MGASFDTNVLHAIHMVIMLGGKIPTYSVSLQGLFLFKSTDNPLTERLFNKRELSLNVRAHIKITDI